MRMLEMHIGVKDLEKSVEFYTKLLPHEKIISDDEKKQYFIVLHDGSAFGIWEDAYHGLYEGLPAKHLHFAFEIKPDEYDEFKKKLESLGVEVIEHTWRDGERSLYFFDADGHQGEFMTKSWL
ncbi:MAG: hypothetical protein DWP97_14500 [Calditrichaeota bacterium]|nr:MAG: hypothetical protein DWP97_14500 [Calditrichota bacterium]